MSTKSLWVVANGRRMGTVFSRAGRLSFCYEQEWQEWGQAFPLSVAMPLPQREHGPAVVDAFLWGLLPDNTRVLEAWGRRFHVSPRNVFGLLDAIGEDCAGAVQFVRPERAEEIMGRDYREAVDWMTDDDLAERLEAVRRDHGAQRFSQDRGQFSLAGAQPKLALYQSPLDGRWGVPYGMTPTTHILKPALGDFEGLAENEHFCLTLARLVGLPGAQSRVILADRIPTIVTRRYDRVFREGKCLRVHQEDLCQAMGIPPERKYQSEGGPGVVEIGQLLYDVSDAAVEDVRIFAKSVIFNFLIAGTDAHAKNYSLLLGARSQVRLAPLYDVVSSLPYPQTIAPLKAKMALKIGGKYKFREVQPSHWEACARELNIRWPEFRELFGQLADGLIRHAPEAAEILRKEGLTHPVIGKLEQGVMERAAGIRPASMER